jgi:SAM-dependent methyltransferase
MELLSSHIANQRRAKVLAHVRGDVLELGCGTGRLYRECRGAVGRYVGIDVSKHAVEEAQRIFPDAQFLRRDIDRETLGFENEFDIVLMVALIEHVFNQGFVLQQSFRALRPGGSVVLTTPTPFGNDIVHRIGARIGLFHSGAMDDHIVIYNKPTINASSSAATSSPSCRSPAARQPPRLFSGGILRKRGQRRMPLTPQSIWWSRSGSNRRPRECHSLILLFHDVSHGTIPSAGNAINHL